MADTVQFEIEGVDALNAKLAMVSDDVRRRGGRFALRKAANLVRDKAQENAQRIDDPETANSIADNIAIRWDGRRFKRTGDLAFRIGVLGGGVSRHANQRHPGGDTYYWRFHELGTEKMQATPFLRPAIAESVNAATNEFMTQYGKAIDRAIRRAQRQSGGV